MTTCNKCVDDVEKEEHFLIHCAQYRHTTETYSAKFKHKIPNFEVLSKQQKICALLGEDMHSCHLAAEYVMTCHQLRGVLQ